MAVAHRVAHRTTNVRRMANDKSTSKQRGNGEGSVYCETVQRASGTTLRWVAQVVVDGQKRRQIAPTEAEAKRQLRKMLAAIDDALPIAPGDLTLKMLLDEWQTKALPNRALSASAAGAHRWACRILIAELGSHKLRNLRVSHVEAAFARLAVDPSDLNAKRAGRGRTHGRQRLGHSSLIKIRSTLNQAVTWAQRRDLIARNIAPLAEIPHIAAAAGEGQSMTVEQAKRFLAAANSTPLVAMWTVMLYLGLRPGEAAGLTWDDIDMKAGTVHVWRNRSVNVRGAAFLNESTKTGDSGIRTLDAPEPVLTVLQVHRTTQKRQQLAAGDGWNHVHDAVFTSPSGALTDPKAVRKEFIAVVTASGVGGHWTPNHLRHSAASLMADAGMPIEQVADQLGHRDLRMLQKHYRHRVRPTIPGGTVMANVLATADHEVQ